MTTVQTVQPTVEARPARSTLRLISFALVVIGLVITSYLSYLKIADAPSVCVAGSVFNCEAVLNSVYSEIRGFPIAWLGWITYVTLGFLLLMETRVAFFKEYGTMLIFGVSLFAWLYSMYLVYLQFFVIKALCPWCLSHEAVMTVFFIIATLRLRKALMTPTA